MPNGCCGQPARQRAAVERPVLPANPRITSGVALLYLGSTKASFRGLASGLTYHVSPYRRRFDVRSEDASQLLRRRDVILSPL